MAPVRRRLVLLLLIGLVITCDQWTKHLVRRQPFPPRTFLGGTLTLLHAENRGAFLSLGSMLPERARTAIFVVGVTALLIAASVALWRGTLQNGIALALIIGGGIGNLIDRIARDGAVTDFLYLRAGPLHTGVFNVADLAITAGAVWMLVVSLRKPRH